jgi:hypothetical protein
MSNDFIEDACDILDRTEAPYIILVGDGPATKVFSNLGEENKAMMERWVDDGHIQQIFRDHFNQTNQ